MINISKTEFPSENPIQELSFAEVEEIDGAVVPFLLGAAYVGIGLSTGTLLAGGGFLVGLEIVRD